MEVRRVTPLQYWPELEARIKVVLASNRCAGPLERAAFGAELAEPEPKPRPVTERMKAIERLLSG
jgi:hypothetical protein